MRMKKKLLFAALVLSMGCFSTSAWALDQKDGVYQINNADDLVDFSNLVFTTDAAANAVLTADIDLAGKTWEPIGTEGNAYHGTFDGQEHRVKNMVINQPTLNYQGLFGVITGGAVIKNIIIDATCYVTANEYSSPLIGGSNGGGTIIIENCGNEANIDCTGANAGGIFGVDMGSAAKMIVRNCYNSGRIVGGRESAGISGWLGDNPEIVACYNIGEVTGVDGEGRDLFRSNGIGKRERCFSMYTTQSGVADIAPESIASGALAYALNGNTSTDVAWFQNIDNGQPVDAQPVPFKSHGTVYVVGTLNCDGTPAGDASSYSNTDASVPTPHDFVDGVCSVCGNVDHDYLKAAADGFFEIATPQQLNWFASLVNKGDNESNARLTADIDFSDYTLNNVMIAHGIRYKGIFDGQEHSITVNYFRDENDAALFGHLEKAYIKNLFVKGKIETSAQFAGGLFVDSWGATVIENVVTDVEIISSISGDGTHGGISAVAHDNIVFRNCAVLGDILADNAYGVGGMVGYTHGQGSTQFINCFVYNEIYVNTSEANSIICRNNPTIRNTYFIDSWGMKEDTGATRVDEPAVASGELAYLLNAKVSGGENWYQNINEDATPLPFKSHKKVYAVGRLKCNGDPADIQYTNTDSQPTRDAHDYDDDGICQNCGARLIKTAAQLMAVADDINIGAEYGDIEITLDADIDLSSEPTYGGIGTRDFPFKGTFDGQGHIISGMNIYLEEDNNHGLIGVVGGDVTVKNVTVDASCSVYLVNAGYAAGIVGASIGSGSLLIENCGNEAEIYTEGANSAGVFGVNDLSQMSVTIRNCYNSGEVTGSRESAGISGWLGNNALVENCFNSGYIQGADQTRPFARENGGSQFINCYESMGDQVTYVDEDQLASGEVCYRLNGSKNGVERYRQTIGTDIHPKLHGASGLVYFDGTNYTNTPTGIQTVGAELAKKGIAVYNANGVRVSTPQKGVNIMRMADGKVRKYIVK